MTLSLHKLWAGSGYEYLTRQVARADESHPRGSLEAYYSDRGEAPGRWIGSGVEDLDGLTVGAEVTAEQMRSLFGEGRHPLAKSRCAEALASGSSDREAKAATRLGSPYRQAKGSTTFDDEVNHRVALIEPDRFVGTGAVRARVVSELAAEWFARDRGRPPADGRELAGAVVRYSRPAAQPVAGFDLMFSPVKSVSTLWAVADRSVAMQIERAHQDAVADALSFLEREALFTREGTNGVRQVEVRGLVATAFSHRDSRAGDPDLHTHVAVANKVQTLAGKWLAVDGRALYAAVVAASETYNTALEGHLRTRLGLRFTERANQGDRRPIREIDGVDAQLTASWSTRRQSIDARRSELARDFQAATGRPPTREEAWELAQRATLETRPGKHEPRTLAEQRATWRSEAVEVLGGERTLRSMVESTLSRRTRSRPGPTVDAAWIAQAAGRVVSQLESERAVWRVWHVRAEAARAARHAGLGAGMAAHVTDLITAEALHRSVPLTSPEVGPPLPDELRRADGSSVYERVETATFSSSRMLAAEERVLATAARQDGRRLDPAEVEVAITQSGVDGLELNDGQAALVRTLASSGARLQLALAPAGTGKSTALRVLSHAWTASGLGPARSSEAVAERASGGNVVGLAPSAAAAAVLAEQLGASCDTLAKLVWSIENPDRPRPDWVNSISHRTLVVVDEAGLADTPSLDKAIRFVIGRGGSVRLIGDDQQLSSPGAGGLLTHLAATFPAARLHDVVRFVDPAEAAASLALRDGHTEALGFYLDQHRIYVGDTTTAPDQLFAAWVQDRQAGLDSLMLAPTRDLVTALNVRARNYRLAGTTPGTIPDSTPDLRVTLRDGLVASVGDTIVTRTNDRRLRTTNNRWVRNGDRWVITHTTTGGAITARPLHTSSSHRRGNVTLPAGYVTESVELGYATTIHGAQGLTSDTMHGLLTGHESRQQLYTMATRGRRANHLYLQLDTGSGLHHLSRPGTKQPTPSEILEQIVNRTGTVRSATATRAHQHDPAVRLHQAATRYLDSLHLAADLTIPTAVRDQLDSVAEQLLPDLTADPSWPALRSTLLLAEPTSPVHLLRLAVATGDLATARDRCAVLIDRAVTLRPSAPGPLPWLPATPDRLQSDRVWGPHLHALTELVRQAAGQLRVTFDPRAGRAWVTELDAPVLPTLLGEVEVWRAAQGIPTSDRSPTGPVQSGSAGEWQRRLHHQLTHTSQPNAAEVNLPQAVASQPDPFLTRLNTKISKLSRSEIDVDALIAQALNAGPLPDDHGAAALWWRLVRLIPTRLLPSADTRSASVDPSVSALPNANGEIACLDPHTVSRSLITTQQRETAENLTDTALLVAAFTRLSAPCPTVPPPPTLDSSLLHVNEQALEFYRGLFPGSWADTYLHQRCGTDLAGDERFQPGTAPDAWTGLVQHLRRNGVSETDMINAGLARTAHTGRLIDVHRHRLVLPIRNHRGELVGFVGRKHPDTTDPRVPKYVNTPTTPLFHKGDQLYGMHLTRADRSSAPPNDTGLVGRTPQLEFTLMPTPVLVEGPIDAIAITLAGNGHYLGVAPLGTALSTTQAASLGALRTDPIVATDNDPAGRAAARRDFWLLAQHRLDPSYAQLPRGTDPATVAADEGQESLLVLLQRARPLADFITSDNESAATDSIPAILRATAARPPQCWNPSLDGLAIRTGFTIGDLREQLIPLANRWSQHPEQAAQEAVQTQAHHQRECTRPPDNGVAPCLRHQAQDEIQPMASGRVRSPSR